MKFPTLYYCDSHNNIREWKIRTEGSNIITEHGVDDGSTQTAIKTAKPKNVGKSNETSGAEQAILQAKAMHKKKLEQKYTEDPSGKKVLLRPMLAHTLSDLSEVQYPVYVQPKLDGCRCLIYWNDDKTDIILESRQGKLFDVEHIKQAWKPHLPSDVVIDGELYKHGIPFETLISWVKNPAVTDRDELEFHYYDCILRSKLSLNQSQRFHLLDNIESKISTSNPMDIRLVRVPTDRLSCKEQLENNFEFYSLEEYEGAILRNPDGVYKIAGRSNDLLKYKEFMEEEFEIIGFKDGDGKEKEVVIWICKTLDGVKFDVRPAGTYESRARLYKEAHKYIGKMLTVKFQGYTEDESLRFPVGKTIRDYE